MKENFQPISNTPPIGFIGKIKFYGRMILDMQILTIYKDVKTHLPEFSGNVLDIGCGQSPYKFLLNNKKTKYFGIDIIAASEFGYNNPEIISFDGKNIPFGNNSFDAIICTEVFEHVQEFQYLADEIFRVAKVKARILITVPWSARFHYIPYDYFRYTPSSLKIIFSKFSDVSITPRGSDISVICSKIIVSFFRNLLPHEKWRYVFFPIVIILIPLLILTIIISHLAILFKIGSKDDPLGYTVLIRK